MVCIAKPIIATMCFILFLPCALPAYAQSSSNLRITEFVYDAEGSDVGREYVEVLNTGPEDINMTSVRFSEHGRSHTIKSWSGETVIKPGDVVVIADKPEEFISQYSFVGTVFDSSFNLNNTGSTLTLIYQGQETHSISYTKQDGANGDGNALHIASDDTLSPSRPSPGSFSGIPIQRKPSDEEDVRTRTTETSNKSPKPTGKPILIDPSTEVKTDQAIYLQTEPNIILSASTTSFSMIERDSGANADEGSALYGAWNFGDGTLTLGDTVSHAYIHPGNYIISFQEYRRDRPTEQPAIQQEVVVLFPQVSVERIDDVFVRFYNHHSFILDVSEWQIISGKTVFTFPQKSFIPANKDIIVPVAIPKTVVRADGVQEVDHNNILFITAGGGQFSGKYQKEVKEGSLDSVNTDFEKNQPAQEMDEKIETPNKTGLVGSSENMVSKSKRLIVWIALLFGITAIALAPLFFVRAEREKNVRRRITRKKK